MATNHTYSVKDKEKSVHDTFIALIAEKQFTTRSEVIVELIKNYVKREERKSCQPTTA